MSSGTFDVCAQSGQGCHCPLSEPLDTVESVKCVLKTLMRLCVFQWRNQNYFRKVQNFLGRGGADLIKIPYLDCVCTRGGTRIIL